MPRISFFCLWTIIICNAACSPVDSLKPFDQQQAAQLLSEQCPSGNKQCRGEY